MYLPNFSPSSAILGSNTIQLSFCFMAGILCLLPLHLQIPSNLELKPLRASLSLSPGFTYCCVSSIALLAPLFLDILFDLAVLAGNASSSAQIKKQKSPHTEAVKFTFLNIPERLMILVGMMIIPVVAFLPKNTDNLGLIYLCCDNCRQNLVGGAVLLSLSRYDKEYWSVRSTWLSLLFYCTGLVAGSFVANIYAGENPPSEFILALDFLCYIFVLAPCSLFLFNSFRWLIIAYCGVNSWKKPLTCFSCVQLEPESPILDSNRSADHKFFPMVYTICGICTVTLLCVLIGPSPRTENFDPTNLLQRSSPYACFLVLISTMSMRMVKFEVVQGLYALIDSRKSYVRYISHELRTPLNSAFLGLKLLTDGLQSSTDPIDIERREILVDVNVACRTTLDILNDLLCFDKMESGILIAHKHEVPVLAFISDCVDMFSAQAREANVTVSYLNGGEESSLSSEALHLLDDDTVFIDKFKMDQVLRNLISNALKFTPRGGSVTVTSTFVPDSTGIRVPPMGQLAIGRAQNKSYFTNQPMTSMGLRNSMFHGGLLRKISGSPTRVCPDSESYLDSPLCTRGRLIIVVKDSGTGMLKEDHSRLFKEIVQFNPEVLQAGGGSGLGLWITKGIVDLHQGEISVCSEGLGYGSSFTVELPMERILFQTDTAVPNVPIERRAVKSMKESLCIFGGKPPLFLPDRGLHYRIEDSKNDPVSEGSYKPVYQLLIVDDSPLNRKMLQRIFREAGHACDEAADGLIAVAKVKETMSSDAKAYSAILMDFVMPNMDGPTATKEIRALGYTAPIFGVTGNTLDSDIDYFIDSGANLVFAKPFNLDSFDSAILGSKR